MAVIDYLAGTFSADNVEEVRVALSRYVPTWAVASGAHGYHSCWAAEGFRLYYAGRPGMGCYMQISGHGCAEVVRVRGADGWGDVLRSFGALGFRASRVDLAFDCHDKQVSCQDVIEAYNRGECVTHLRRSRISSEESEGRKVSNVLHLGRIDSETSVCIYDKQLERIARSGEDPGHWVRFELRYKHKRASEVCQWVIEHSDLVGAEGLLASTVEFRSPLAGVPKQRWVACSWWLEFLNGGAKVRVYRSKVVRSLEMRAASWVRRQAATLAMLTLCLCNGKLEGRWLRDMLGQGWVNMSEVQERLVQDTLGFLPVNVNPNYKGIGVPK